MLASPEERFRQLFRALDAEGEWSKFLDSRQLAIARAAAETDVAWHSFLAAVPPREPVGLQAEVRLEGSLNSNGLVMDLDHVPASAQKDLQADGIYNGKSKVVVKGDANVVQADAMAIDTPLPGKGTREVGESGFTSAPKQNDKCEPEGTMHESDASKPDETGTQNGGASNSNVAKPDGATKPIGVTKLDEEAKVAEAIKPAVGEKEKEVAKPPDSTSPNDSVSQSDGANSSAAHKPKVATRTDSAEPVTADKPQPAEAEPVSASGQSVRPSAASPTPKGKLLNSAMQKMPEKAAEVAGVADGVMSSDRNTSEPKPTESNSTETKAMHLTPEEAPQPLDVQNAPNDRDPFGEREGSSEATRANHDRAATAALLGAAASTQRNADVEKRQTSPNDILATSTIVRRRLAIASVDEQFFSSLAEDSLYEPDEGLMDGSDGGYTNFAELAREEEGRRGVETGVFKLLGYTEEASKSTPKRPRASLRPKVQLQFIRDVSKLCESEINGDVERKQSSSTVEKQFREFEKKATDGEFSDFESCVSAVDACLKRHKEALGPVLDDVQKRVEVLRDATNSLMERLEEKWSASMHTTGIIGARVREISPGAAGISLSEATHDSPKSESPPEGQWNRKVRIPFSDATLRCWSDSSGGATTAWPRLPRVPQFRNSPTSREGILLHGRPWNRGERASVVDILGPESYVVRNMRSLKRVRSLRETAVKAMEAASSQSIPSVPQRIAGRTAMQKANANGKSGAEGSLQQTSPVKVEPTQTSGADTRKQTEPTRKKQGFDELPEELVLEISNNPEEVAVEMLEEYDGNTRERAMGRAVCALLCAHGGFTHSSNTALDVLTEVLERYLHDVGKSLVACRENIDNNQASVAASKGEQRRKTKEEVMEELLLICTSGFRGGFPELQYYAKTEMARTEQAILEAELRIRHRLQALTAKRPELGADSGKEASASAAADGKETEKATAAATSRRNMETIQSQVSQQNESRRAREPQEIVQGAESDKVVSEADVSLDADAFMFGYLNNKVRLDVLGEVKVPGVLVFTDAEVEKKRSPSSCVEMNENAVNATNKSATVSPVKAEVSLMDIDSG